MELYVWLEKRGWKPKWHTEPQDSVDFTIKNIQKYLQRLVREEGTLADQVENKRKQLELAKKLEEDDNVDFNSEEEDAEASIEYEGESELEEEIDDDDGALN